MANGVNEQFVDES